MSRLAEWTLGIVGAALGIISALAVWKSGAEAQKWPFPALVLAAWAVLAMAAPVGIALDAEGHSRRWGLLTWFATGALLGSAVIGFLEFGLFVLPAIIALAGAAVLADKRRGRRGLRHLGLAVATAAVVFFLELTLAALLPIVAQADDLDYDLPDGSGHFYRQANGQGGQGETGYAITDADSIPFWDEYRRLGGPEALGYPASRRFVWNGFVVQAMQKVVFQWRPETRTVAFVNVVDLLHDAGKDDWLQVFRQTPPPFDTAPDTGLSWNEVTRRHWAFLDTNRAIKARYWADTAPLDHFGLPMSYADEGNSFVVRAQRAIFQYWKEDVPWARQGQVSIANGGDLAKETGLFPPAAITPEPPPGTSPPLAARIHDWRAPGYVSAVAGQLYDPRCVPLRSIGSNVPNLLYRDGLGENLEWMRQHRLRWMRVFATGHALGPDRAPRDAASATAALGSLLSRVEAFNGAHDPSEAIYVLMSLTDYYPPGVPGDRHAFDHPTFRLSPVLPAPWFRAGIRQFDFEQEHGLGLLSGLPNYEVNYKPWVRQIVSSLAQSRALMGWQLGNELKARNSARNGISATQAYDWYLGFTRDIVDAIRSLDRNHLIFMGAQYIAELADWEYRPNDHLAPDRVPEYRQLVQRMLDACGENCWNVWSLTAYDFNPYPVDDAAMFSEAGVPVVATEYGLTWGTPAEMQARFGGDRAAAVQNGFGRWWQELSGRDQPRLRGVPELFANGLVSGVAPWGSPAPGSGAELDMDGGWGITGMPDEAALWSAWSSVAGSLENANRTAGASAACPGFRSVATP